MALGDLLGQPDRRTKVPVLADDDRYIIFLFVGKLHQVNGKADINAFLLALGTHPPVINIDASAPEIPELVPPKAVPKTLSVAESCVGNAGVKADLGECSARNSTHQGIGEFLYIIAWPVVIGGGIGGSPCVAHCVVEVLAVKKDNGPHA